MTKCKVIEEPRRSPRTRAKTMEIVNNSLLKAQEIFNTDGAVKYIQGMKPNDFMNKFLKYEKEHGKVLGLDLKEMVRAPRNKELNEFVMFYAAARIHNFRVTMTGEKSQDYFLRVIKHVGPKLKQLEILLPKYAKVAFQKELMDSILHLQLETLIMYGSFNCVHVVPQPDVEPTLHTLKCPGDSRAKNNFVDMLLSHNKKTIVRLELHDDLKLETKRKTGELESLCVLGVESFSDLDVLEGLPTELNVLVRGSSKISFEQEISVIANAKPPSFLKDMKRLALMGYLGTGMTQVVEAVGQYLPNVVKLNLFGWDHPVVDVLRKMPHLKRLRFTLSCNLDPEIIDAISAGDILPNLERLNILVVKFKGLTSEELSERLRALSLIRPELRVDWEQPY